jgi:transposase
MSRGGHNKTYAATEEKIIAAYQTGELTKLVAARFGIADTCVRNILRRHGITPSHAKVLVTPDQAAEMLRLNGEGKLNREIAAAVGVAEGTVSKWLRAQGVAKRFGKTGWRMLTLEKRFELAERYQNGETYAELYKAYGITSAVVQSCLAEFGVKVRCAWGRFKQPPWTDRLGRVYEFKSTWERAYAAHLDTQKLCWEYEARKFGLKECRCYTPDFEVVRGGCVEYHDVKGWMDDRCVARLQEFVRMYPEIRVRMVGPLDLQRLGIIDGEYAQHGMALKVDSVRQWLDGVCQVAARSRKVGAR